MADFKISDIPITTTTLGTGALFETETAAGVSEKTPESVARAGMQKFLPFFESLALSDLTTAITTGTSKAYWRLPFGVTHLSFRASLLEASTSGTPTVDVNKNGSTIMSTKLTIDANETTSLTAASAAVLTSTTGNEDDILTFDIDVAGTGAKGLIVTITGKRAA